MHGALEPCGDMDTYCQWNTALHGCWYCQFYFTSNSVACISMRILVQVQAYMHLIALASWALVLHAHNHSHVCIQSYLCMQLYGMQCLVCEMWVHFMYSCNTNSHSSTLPLQVYKGITALRSRTLGYFTKKVDDIGILNNFHVTGPAGNMLTSTPNTLTESIIFQYRCSCCTEYI